LQNPATFALYAYMQYSTKIEELPRNLLLEKATLWSWLFVKPCRREAN